jgi:hypothetical protein
MEREFGMNGETVKLPTDVEILDSFFNSSACKDAAIQSAWFCHLHHWGSLHRRKRVL